MSDVEYLSAAAAAAELGVSLATLYAYASRGMLRSEPVPGEPRARRYPREDVLRLKERKELRRDPERAAERAAPRALHWGAPVLESAITLVEGGRLYYRGRDVVELSRTASVEEVAALIWTGDPTAAGAIFAESAGTSGEESAGASLETAGTFLLSMLEVLDEVGLSPVERCQLAVPLAGTADLAAWDLRPRSVAACGVRILRLLAMVLAAQPAAAESPASPPPRPGTSIATLLQQGWSPGRPQAARPLGAALVLCADHELNVSAFTARCVASAAATPWDVVGAGLAALKGGKHGGYADRVEALFREAGTPEAARRALADRLRRGEEVPGFGQPLYPQGDPRGRELLALAAAAAPGSPAVTLAEALAAAARELIGELPTLDFGLVALARALALPAGAPLALFALGRSIGWIGHALEEYALDRLIRPRAAYVGERPARS